MKYEASRVEMIRFDGDYFMTFSGDFSCPPYDPSKPGDCQNYTNNSTGIHCGDYQQGSRCGNFSYPGFTCGEYNGSSGTVNGIWYDNNAPACGVF